MARRRTPQTRAEDAEWNFRSFPVYFAFACGAFIATLFFPIFPLPVFVVSLFGVSFGTAHMMSRWLRRRTLDRTRSRQEEDERERRALAARAAAARDNEAASQRRRQRRRGGGRG